MTKEAAEETAAEYRAKWAGTGWTYVVVESPRTLLDETPKWGGHYVRRERAKAQ